MLLIEDVDITVGSTDEESLSGVVPLKASSPRKRLGRRTGSVKSGVMRTGRMLNHVYSRILIFAIEVGLVLQSHLADVTHLRLELEDDVAKFLLLFELPNADRFILKK